MNDQTEATYMGQKPDMGKIVPTEVFPGEGFASLKCGNTEVVLTYSALHKICGHLAVGAVGDWNAKDCSAIQRAFQSITCEASLGRTPDK